ncbi:MAG: hypothetical protein GY861_19570 [bacterium]|nr:hypothetical protein [bacterium]
MTTDISKKYEVLKKKYKLPDFDWLDQEFNLASIEKDKFLLRDIRSKIISVIDNLCDIIGNVLQPEGSIAGLCESRVLDDAGKNQVFSAYKKLMSINRKALEISIRNEESSDAEFIKEASDFWKNFKGELIPIIKKLQDSWENDTEQNDKLGYLG